MIYFDRVFKKYEPQGKNVLNNINFSVSEGDFVYIVGPSGAGKTTLLKLLLGEEEPTGGEVLFRSLNIHNLDARDVSKYRRQIGAVFQDLKLFDDKTVLENLTYTSELGDVEEDIIEDNITNALKAVGLSGYENRFPRQLSGGEKQRLAFARAIINEPNILLADEPTAWLDEDNANRVLEILNNIHDMGTTIIVTTHKKNLVGDGVKKNSRTIFLDEGKIIGVSDTK